MKNKIYCGMVRFDNGNTFHLYFAMEKNGVRYYYFSNRFFPISEERVEKFRISQVSV